MGLTVTVLGCCGSFPVPGGACSGYLVRGGGTTVWVDAGSGSLANLQRHVELGEIDAIVLSHEHPDHWSDLESYYVAAKYVYELESRPVYAPAGLRRYTYHDNEKPWFTWHPVASGDRVDIGGLTFSFSRTDHPPETLAMRIDSDGHSLVYSADTGPEWSLSALGSGIDLALCEATFQREQEGEARHLSARQAGATARESGVSRLLLTHIWPVLDSDRSRVEGAEAFGADVDVAATNESYEV